VTAPTASARGPALDWPSAVRPLRLDATGVVTNTTVTQATATSGDLVVFPDKRDPSAGYLVVPTTSTLNFTKGATVPNLTITAPGTDGKVDLLNQSAGSLHLIVDVYGYFQSE